MRVAFANQAESRALRKQMHVPSHWQVVTKTNSGAPRRQGFSLDAAAHYLHATAVYLDAPPSPIHFYFKKDKLGGGETFSAPSF